MQTRVSSSERGREVLDFGEDSSGSGRGGSSGTVVVVPEGMFSLNFEGEDCDAMPRPEEVDVRGGTS